MKVSSPGSQNCFYESGSLSPVLRSILNLANSICQTPTYLLFTQRGCEWMVAETGHAGFHRSIIPYFETPVQKNEVQETLLRGTVAKIDGGYFSAIQLITNTNILLGYLGVANTRSNQLADPQKKVLVEFSYQITASLELLQKNHHLSKENREQKKYISTQQQYQKLFEQGRELDIIVDSNRRVKYVNAALKSILGYSPKTVLGKKICELPLWIDSEHFRKKTESLVSGQRHEFECCVRTKSGKSKWINWVIATDEDQWLLSGRDITGQKQTEADYGKLWVANHIDQAVSISDTNGRILWINQAYSKLSGYTTAEVLGKRTGDILFGEKTSYREIADARRQARKGSSFSFELQVYNKSGNPIWVLVHSTVVALGDGKQEKIIEIFTDITARKKQEIRLETLTIAAQKAAGGIAVQDPFGKLLWVNEALEQMLGYSLSELQEKNLEHIVVGERTNRKTLEMIFHSFEKHRPYQAEIELYTKDGIPRWFHIASNPVYNKQKHPERTVFLIYDINSKKQSELRLQKLSSVATHSSNAIIFRNLEGKITWVNNAFEQIFGYSAAEAIATPNYTLLVGPGTDKIGLNKVLKLIKAGQSGVHEQTLYHKDGSPRYVIASANPVTDRNGKTQAVAWNLTDITDIRKKDQEINELSLIAQKSPTGIIMRNLDSKTQWVNNAFQEITGYKSDEIPGHDFKNLFSNAQSKLNGKKAFLKALSKGKVPPTEVLLKKKDGSDLWVELKAFPILNQSGKPESIVILISDITLRKKAEQEIRMLSLVASRTVIGVAINDKTGRIQWNNAAFEKITGYSESEVKGHILGSILMHDKTNKEELKRARRLARQKQSYYTELLVSKKDGTPFWMAVSGTPVLDNRGNLIQEVEIIDDITERKNAEFQLIKTREDALHLSKAKETFLSVMSHEIRTPLNSIVGITELLLDNNPTVEQQDLLQLLKFSGDNLKVLINDILDLTKMETGNLVLEETRFNLEELISNTITSLQVKADENNTKLLQKIDQAIPGELIGDPVRIYQILMNLLGNAIKFTHAGKVTLQLRLLKETESSVSIKFEISDTGIGIAKDKLDTIFEPYTQASADTTRKFGGTGLGLAIVKNLLEAHNSNIHVSSTPGKGTKFTFSITFQKHAQVNLLAQDNQRTLKILVVDDNEINLRLTAKVLESLGAEIDFAVNGQQALEKVKNHRYDCVLMDLHMPEMSGIEATRRIRSMADSYFKTLPIIGFSGSSDENDLKMIEACGMNGYLTKPFSKEKILDTIRKYTNSTSSGHILETY